jgi:serine/threonine-protein phosphatase 6 regulatory ankyrin repeat subunit A/serine/threonine-protein phosphatase 6 regulatory ankyrin repeat subunit B
MVPEGLKYLIIIAGFFILVMVGIALLRKIFGGSNEEQFNASISYMRYSNNINPTVMSYTPLHNAVFSQKEADIRSVIRKGADIDAKTLEEGMQVMHIAAASGNGELCKLLVKLGAELNQCNIYGFTELFFTTDIEMARLLVQLGSNVEAVNDAGNTMYAISLHFGLTKKMEIFKALGAKKTSYIEPMKPTLPKKFSHLLREERYNKKNLISIHALKTFYNPDFAPYTDGSHFGTYAIDGVILKGDIETLGRMIGRGFDPNQTSYGIAPIHIAVLFDLKDMILFLVSIGADVNQPTKGLIRYKAHCIDDSLLKNDQCLRALHIAAIMGYKDSCRLLIELGAKFNQLSSFGFTELFFAESFEMAQLLFNGGSKVEFTNKTGNTMSSIASFYNLRDKIEVFSQLNAKSKRYIESTNSTFPRQKLTAFVSKPNSSDNLDTENSNLKCRSTIHEATSTSDIDAIRWQIALGVSPDTHESGFTALHLACISGSFQIIRFLVGKGADVNLPTEGRSNYPKGSNDSSYYKVTPIHLAAERGDPKICKYLVESGARLNEFSGDQYSELYYAKNIETVYILIGLGSALDAVSKDGNTIITVLTHYERPEDEEKRELLLSLGAKVNEFEYSEAYKNKYFSLAYARRNPGRPLPK